jgi:hypothetical protein
MDLELLGQIFGHLIDFGVCFIHFTILLPILVFGGQLSRFRSWANFAFPDFVSFGRNLSPIFLVLQSRNSEKPKVTLLIKIS